MKKTTLEYHLTARVKLFRMFLHLKMVNGAYCFAAAASLPSGFIPLFMISSLRFRIGIPSIYSIANTLLRKLQSKLSEVD
ncbi:hypothetical protein HanXRQr2_Chr13g0588051 [Helianthus annuus]|uniref:Uncharacterized protein n=1 Tax=Helianthus annuus TaxID=4232 RepID=A0A9K3EGT5_HELAN|nr:hypothetical protein HanXRQr2_Chr13g0588051 [Helianthus annuus]KAJ0849211.1 hypothetical protein HanPSC8_Chr13g0566251 [Helianthus annuus]